MQDKEIMYIKVFLELNCSNLYVDLCYFFILHLFIL